MSHFTRKDKKAAEQQEAQMAELRYILTMPPELRSEEQCSFICEFLIEGKFLKRVKNVKNNEDFRELARYIKLESFAENSIVFNQGDEGDAFYIILSGKVRGFLPNAGGKDKKGGTGEEEFIFSMTKGQGFGDIALETDDLRSCSIKTTMETELMVIKRDIYKQFCGDLRKQHIKEIHNFFEENMLMRALSHETKSLLCNKSFTRRYAANTTILFQGEPPANLYFIMKGGVKLIRNIRKSKLKKMALSKQYRNEFNTIEDKITQEIQTLYKGSQFADYEVLHQKDMQNSVITIIPTLLLSISIHDLRKVMNNDEFQMLENNTDKPQTNEEIMDIFLENCYWKRFKNNLVQNVLSDKKIKYTGKGKMFRVNTGKYSEMNSYYHYLINRGLYVFSGSGLTFPDLVDHNRKPFEKETQKRKVGFGTSFSHQFLQDNKSISPSRKCVNLNKTEDPSNKTIPNIKHVQIINNRASVESKDSFSGNMRENKQKYIQIRTIKRIAD